MLGASCHRGVEVQEADVVIVEWKNCVSRWRSPRPVQIEDRETREG